MTSAIISDVRLQDQDQPKPDSVVTDEQRKISSLIKSAQPAEAIKHLMKKKKNTWVSRDWFLYGQALFRLLKFKKALQAFRTGLKKDPDNMLAIHYCGLCLERMQKYRKALKHYKIAQKSIPEAGNKVMFFEDGGIRRMRRRDRFERRMNRQAFLFPFVVLPALIMMALVIYVLMEMNGLSGTLPISVVD